MPADTLLLNTRAGSLHSYDAIVVGSGMSGGWAAKELCEKGMKVLMLDRGRPLEHPHYPNAAKDPWEFPHRYELTQADKEKRFVQSRHWSLREDNKDYYIVDTENPYVEEKRFDWIRGDIVGGRSLLWSRACYRWSDLDFEANLKDGVGVDWPIRYKDIAPWYDYVEPFVGVSGNRDGIAHLPDGTFQPPFEMNAVEKYFKGRIEGKYPDRHVIIGRTANMTRSIGNRGPCQARNLCHRGYPYGAYFSSNSASIPAALATGNLTIRPYSLVSRVLYHEKRQRAKGVELIDMQTGRTVEYYARLIFLNASTLGTGYILLHSTSSRFPNGLGNGSGQVGRNLMDHHKGVEATARVEGFLDSYYYGRRPTPLFIPRFRNVDKPFPGFTRGYFFGASANRSQAKPDAPLGKDMKAQMTEAGEWQMNLYAFGESLPHPDNRISLHPDKKDAWGLPQLVVDCMFRENETAMHRDMLVTAPEMLQYAGFRDVQVKDHMSFPGNANHEMGVARMGRDPKTSVLNGWNQMHEVSNVFITDGACMTSGSCVNPSLTYMALTARACHYALQECKKGNI